MSIQESFDWVALPAGLAPPVGGGDGRGCRVSVFVAPQVRLADEPARALRLDELADLVDWPATLTGIALEIEVDGQPPVAATRVGQPPSSELWRRLFPGASRVDPFVPDDPTIHTVMQYGAVDVLDVIETGYAQAAKLEPPVEDHYDPAFWEPGRWMPELDLSPDIGALGEVDPEEEIILGGETDEGGVVDDERLIRNLFPPVHEVIVEPDNSWLHGPGVGGTNLLTHVEFVAGERRAVANGEGSPLSTGAALEMARFADAVRLSWDSFDRPVAAEAVAPEAAAAEAVTVVVAPEVIDLDVARQTAAERQAALVDSYDLHRIVAALGDHPALLRALGLVIDVEVPMDAPEPGRIRVVVRRPAGAPGRAAPIDRTPWVAVTSAAPNGFAATSATDDVAPPGLEALDRYHIVQLDLESAGIQLLERAAAEATNPAAGGRELPPLRTAGLRLVERGAAVRLVERAAHANELRLVAAERAGDKTLDADDVQRGFRLDVMDETSGRWHSLHARLARYSGADGLLLGPVTDEGSFTGSFTGRPLAPGENLDAGDAIAVDESLVTWDGWSLAAPRPGAVVSADPRDADAVHRAERGTEIIGRPTNDPLTSTGLRIDTATLPGSLPRLRFGHAYRMRLRSVDLAGNALTVTQADQATAGAAITEPVTFRRFERVPPPVVAFAPDPDGPAPLRRGERERRLVVRSGLDDGDDTFGAAPGTDERLLFAPECSVALAEWHGGFDDAIGAEASAAARAAAYRRAGREAGTLQPGTTELPWLADPASAGACLSGLPGMEPDEVLTIAWPSSPVGPGPIRLRLVALDEDELRAPEVDESAGLVTAFLPPGGRATAAVSSMLADQDTMALPALWRERLDAKALAVAEQRLARHRHALVTPSLPIEVVHATQRPRLAPQPDGPAELEPRSPDQTSVRVLVPWTVHAPSTGTLELEATWVMPRDEPADPSDALGVLSALLGPIVEGTGRIPAVDTVTTGMGRPRVLPAVPAEGPFTTSVWVGDTPDGAAANASPGASVDLDTTAHVRLRLRAIATSRYAEFFPPEYGPAAATDDTPARESRIRVISEDVVIDVPNTRRPPAPSVLEAMPLIVRHHEDGLVRREGGWLRVWLARPWFVSGFGEAPALIAAANGQPRRPGQDSYHLSTLVGPDPARGAPVFAGATLAALAGYSDEPPGLFPDVWADVHLAETKASDENSRRTIVRYDRAIEWDPHRGAWYVDLRVYVPGLYFPFVRLAIARAQPHSIPGTTQADEFRVSPVVTLDPIQVLPDRELRHTIADDTIHLELTGRSYDVTLMPVDRGSPEFPNWVMEPLAGGAPSAARVIAQRRVRSGGDELLAWEDVFEQPMLQADAPAGTLAAKLTLPFDPTDPPGEFRLLVLEEDFAYGPQIFQHPEGTRARVTFAEVVPLPRGVARGTG